MPDDHSSAEPALKAEDLPPLPHGRPLSDVDRDLFLAILDNPPPNAALRKLMRPDQAAKGD